MNKSKVKQADEDYTLGPNILDLLQKEDVKDYNAFGQTSANSLFLEARNLDSEGHKERLDYIEALMPIEFPVIGEHSLFHRHTQNLI